MNTTPDKWQKLFSLLLDQSQKWSCVTTRIPLIWLPSSSYFQICAKLFFFSDGYIRRLDSRTARLLWYLWLHLNVSWAWLNILVTIDIKRSTSTGTWKRKLKIRANVNSAKNNWTTYKFIIEACLYCLKALNWPIYKHIFENFRIGVLQEGTPLPQQRHKFTANSAALFFELGEERRRLCRHRIHYGLRRIARTPFRISKALV